MEVIKIKNGINLNLIKTDKFKTNLLSVFLTVPLNENTITKNSLIPAILRRGSNNLKTQEEISKTQDMLKKEKNMLLKLMKY